MFGRLLGNKVSQAASKFNGNTDFLEAVCAAAALIAGADGEIEDGEIKATLKAVKANKTLSAGFDQNAIDACANRMLERAAGGRVGRMGLWDEIKEVAKLPEMAQAVVLTALDVAEGDGEIEPAEQAVLERLAKEMSVDLKSLMGV
jgi:tellurite resistance protein TerB